MRQFLAQQDASKTRSEPIESGPVPLTVGLHKISIHTRPKLSLSFLAPLYPTPHMLFERDSEILIPNTLTEAVKVSEIVRYSPPETQPLALGS